MIRYNHSTTCSTTCMGHMVRQHTGWYDTWRDNKTGWYDALRQVGTTHGATTKHVGTTRDVTWVQYTMH